MGNIVVAWFVFILFMFGIGSIANENQDKLKAECIKTKSILECKCLYGSSFDCDLLARKEKE